MVVVNGNKLDELDFEIASKKQLKGNIYLAKVTRVEPSLQAAFVEYGGNRHGFLAFSEIHPDYYRIPVADREALLAQERDLEEREDTTGADIEMGDPRPGRGQRRSFRGEPRGDDKADRTLTSDQQPIRAARRQPRSAAGRTGGRSSAGRKFPASANSRLTKAATDRASLRIRSRRPSPTSATFRSTGSRRKSPCRKLPLRTARSSRTVRFRKTAGERDAEPDQDGGSDDKPTTYQPANLPRDERSEPYEPSDSDAGQAKFFRRRLRVPPYDESGRRASPAEHALPGRNPPGAGSRSGRARRTGRRTRRRNRTRPGRRRIIRHRRTEPFRCRRGSRQQRHRSRG